MLVRVAQGEDRVDHCPRQHDGEHGDADEQHLNGTAASTRLDECDGDAQEASHTCTQQQQGRGALGLVLALGQLFGARTVGSEDDWPNAGEEDERGGVPACHRGHPPRYEP